MKKALSTLLVLLMVFALSACSTQSTATQTVTGNIEVVESETPTTDAETIPQDETETTTPAAVEDIQTHEDVDDYTWEESQVVEITLTGDRADASNSAVTVDGSLVTISAAGTYSLSGTLDDGQIIVDTKDEDTVKIILDGVNLSSKTSAPIFIKDAEKVVLILAEGSKNILSDASVYVNESTEENEPNAVLFSDSDLTIWGSGTLNVTGNYNDGIASKDGLIIAGGKITVSAVDDGIRGKDYLVVKDASVTVTSNGDGLKADNDMENELGFILVQSSSLEVTSGGDAISAQGNVFVYDGEFTLTSGGGSGVWLDGETSAKGINGLASVVINSGTFTINAADDAIHSNGDITINGGSYQLASGDDGMHADTTLTINDGEVSVIDSYEGIESATITINSGTLRIAASDDGINVASGVDGSGLGMTAGGFMPGNPPQSGQPGSLPSGQPGDRPTGGPMQDAFAEAGDYYLYINGGNIYVNADGDGIDVNGSIEMSAGLVIVNGPTENMNGALDYLGSFTISGGTLIAVGSAGMAQAPSESSSQNSVLINLDASQSAGTPIHIQDAAGTNLVTFTPTKSYQSFVFSSANMLSGGDYTIFSGGNTSGEAVDGLTTSGSYEPGSELTSFTVSGVTTILGNTTGMGGGRRK